MLSSIVGGIFRGTRTAGRRESGDGKVVDMKELERRLREARAQQPAEPSTTPAREPSPQADTPRWSPAPAVPDPRPAPSAATTSTTSPGKALRPVTLPGTATAVPASRPPVARAERPVRRTLQPRRLSAPEDDWGLDPNDLDWDREEMGSHGRSPTRPSPSAAAGRTPPLPAAVQRYLDREQPWQAAVVIAEILGPPRALLPYRVWPRR